MNTLIVLLALLLSPFGIEVGTAAPATGADSTGTCLVATLQRMAWATGDGGRRDFHLCIAVEGADAPAR